VAQYNSKSAFLSATIAHLGANVLTAPLRMQPVHVHVASSSISTGVRDEHVGATGGGKTVAIVEMHAVDAKCQNGVDYTMRVSLCHFVAARVCGWAL
jgi:hypothetical protein